MANHGNGGAPGAGDIAGIGGLIAAVVIPMMYVGGFLFVRFWFISLPATFVYFAGEHPEGAWGLALALAAGVGAFVYSVAAFLFGLVGGVFGFVLDVVLGAIVEPALRLIASTWPVSGIALAPLAVWVAWFVGTIVVDVCKDLVRSVRRSFR